MPECRERLLEPLDRLLIGRAPGRPGAGLLQIGNRLVPDLPMKRMVSQAVDVLRQTISTQSLYCLQYADVERPPPLVQKSHIGHLVGKRVLEGVFGVRKE